MGPGAESILQHYRRGDTRRAPGKRPIAWRRFPFSGCLKPWCFSPSCHKVLLCQVHGRTLVFQGERRAPNIPIVNPTSPLSGTDANRLEPIIRVIPEITKAAALRPE